MKARYWFFSFLGLLTLLRLVFIGHTELSPDESYYYLWSQRLDLSYFSKGPGVALAIRIGTDLFGANEFGVRFFSPMLGLGTSLLLFFLARRLYGEQVGIWTAVAMNMIPIFQVGSLVMTIDPLSIFFWAAALFTFWLTLEREGCVPSRPGSGVDNGNKNASTGFNFWWPVTGLLIGAGFLAKYTNAMEILSVVLMLLSSPKLRREFSKPGFYLMLAAFALCTVPVIVWNQQHAWITMAHLKARGGLNSAFGIHPEELLAFLAMHLGVYSPLMFAGMMMALWWALPMARTQVRTRFLLVFALPLLVMYFLLSIKRAGEPNWTAPAFVSLGILSGALWHDLAQRSASRARFAAAAMAIGLVMSLGVINMDLTWKITAAPRRALASLPSPDTVSSGWWKSVLAFCHEFSSPNPYDLDPGARLRGWKTTAEEVGKLRTQFEQQLGQPVFLIGNKYQTAAILAFYLADKRVESPGHPPVYVPESQNIENQFSFWRRYDEFVAQSGTQTGPAPTTAEEEFKLIGASPFVGRTALYITDNDEDQAAPAIRRGFERVEMIAILELRRRNEPLRTIRVFACHNYRSLQL